jgi:PKHD-type hydroxylase
MKVFENVLSAQELAVVRAMVERAPSVSGSASALGMARRVKANEQFELTPADGQALANLTFAALKRNPLFYRFALPVDVSMPMINRYAEGMCYGPHYDASVMPSPTGAEIRTDFSATLFVSGPDEYDGGELLFDAMGMKREIKLRAGDMVLYPAGLLHEVRPVTRGARHAIVFWVQSRIAESEQRQLLFRMDEAVGSLAHKHPDLTEVRELLGVFQNLSRMWMR